MRVLRAPFHFVHTAGVLQREHEMLASTCTRCMRSFVCRLQAHKLQQALNIFVSNKYVTFELNASVFHTRHLSSACVGLIHRIFVCA